jgi:hypothetical protein
MDAMNKATQRGRRSAKSLAPVPDDDALLE